MMIVRRIMLLFCLIVFLSTFLSLTIEVSYADSKNPKEQTNILKKVYKGVKDLWNEGVHSTKNKINATEKKIKSEIEAKVSQVIKETLPLPANSDRCKMDPTCYFSSWIKTVILNFFEEICQIFADVIVISEEELFGKETKGVYVYYQKVVQNLAWTFLVLFLTFQSIRILAFYTIEVDPTELKLLIQRLIITSILIALEPKIIGWLVHLNELLVNAFLEPHKGVLGYTIFLFLITEGVNLLPLPGGINLIIGIPVLIINILLFIIMLQFVLRYAEIALLMILGPFAIATNINQEYNLFPVWWRHLLSTIFTQAVQVLLIVIWISIIRTALGIDVLYRLILSIGFLVVAVRAPGFLREWMHSTGGTQMTMSGVRAGVKTITSVAKTAVSFAKP